jgi:subtilisin family serine protease
VGAVNHLDGIIEPYSSQGPTNNGKLAPHVVGPDGVTTLALDGKPFFGTSATTPYVAGLAALILENNPGTSPEQLLTLIQQNADRALFSIQNEYDYALGYGTASAGFLIENSEAMQ